MKEETIRYRRVYEYAQKKAILDEHFERGLSISALSRKYQIQPVTLYRWKRMHIMAKQNPIPEPDVNQLTQENEGLKRENQQLRKALADLALDKAVLKDAVEILKKKQLEPHQSKRPKPLSPLTNIPDPECAEI